MQGSLMMPVLDVPLVLAPFVLYGRILEYPTLKDRETIRNLIYFERENLEYLKYRLYTGMTCDKTC